jgi:hypothetical protein
MGQPNRLLSVLNAHQTRAGLPVSERVISGSRVRRADQHAWEIHTTGASVVAQAPKERADPCQEQLAARGFRVTVEPDYAGRHIACRGATAARAH